MRLDPKDERLLGAIARSTCQRTGSPVCGICEPLHGRCRQRAIAAIAAINDCLPAADAAIATTEGDKCEMAKITVAAALERAAELAQEAARKTVLGPCDTNHNCGTAGLRAAEAIRAYSQSLRSDKAEGSE